MKNGGGANAHCDHVNTGFVNCDGNLGSGNNAYAWFMVIQYTLTLNESSAQQSTCCCRWGTPKLKII